MSYIGDFRLSDTFDVKFCLTVADVPTTLGGTPVISAYVGNSVTQITAGITLSVDFDGVTGLNNVRVVASGANGYATASNYQLVVTTGTIGAVSAVGRVVAEFSIENRSALMPTTATRTLDVSAGGEAGVDWANVGSPTTTLGLTGTTVATTTNLTTNNDKTGYALSATGSAALTESYNADGVAGTLPQLLYLILAMLTELSRSGTTLTAKKLDGSTTAATFTINDASAPTSITRAS